MTNKKGKKIVLTASATERALELLAADKTCRWMQDLNLSLKSMSEVSWKHK